MTSCQRLQNSISPLFGGLLRQKCHHGKMLGTISFHILWTSRSSFSPCPYGIVVVVFHFDSGGRKAKQTGGYFATVGLPLQRTCNTLPGLSHRLRVLQQDTEVFTNMIYILLMFYNAVFSDQRWGHLAT